MKRTKIIATAGPACDDLNTMCGMLREGVDAIRINFSHGDKGYWEKLVSLVRESSELVGKRVALIGDLMGPTIRLGTFQDVVAEKGDEILFYLGKEGDERGVPVSEERFFSTVRDGDIVLIDEGKIRLVVKQARPTGFTGLVLDPGVIRAEKGVAIRDKTIKLPPLSEKDVKDANFAIRQGFDYVGMSFVRSQADIEALRGLFGQGEGPSPGVVAKIETREAIENVSGVVQGADAVLVARGDLGLHFDLEDIPSLQKLIVDESLGRGRPSIVATQLLESMMESPSPTRSEVVDIMTAVEDGADALMLSGETAVGKHPMEAVRWMKKVVEGSEAEKGLTRVKPSAETMYDKFVRGICLLSDSMGAKIVVYTRTGATAKRISAQRPESPVYAAANDEGVVRRLAIFWGVNAYLVPAREEVLPEFLDVLKSEGKLSYGDLIVFTYGLRRGATDTVRIVRV